MQLQVTTSDCGVSIKYPTALLRSLHAMRNSKYRCTVFTGCAFFVGIAVLLNQAEISLFPGQRPRP
jgi:hypothetical protein